MKHKNTFPLTYGLIRVNLPLIPIEIQNKSLCFLLDAGSNLNMIDIAVYEYFKEIAEPKGEFTHFGIEGNQEQTITVTLPLSFNGCTYTPVFSVVNLDNAFSKVYEESGISKGVKESQKIAAQGGKIAGNTRKQIEAQTGKKVVSRLNAKSLKSLEEKTNK